MTPAMPSSSFPSSSAAERPEWFPLTRRFFRFLQQEAGQTFLTIGQTVETTSVMLRFLLAGRLKWQHFVQQGAFVGWDTLGIALVLVTFSAMVIALQVAKEMVRQGASDYVGALVSLAVLRELAPVMTGVAVIAMAGSSFAAELSTMNITQQVDALRTLHIHPVRYLVLPRAMAGIVVIPLMTVITATAGIFSGMIVSYALADVNFWTYLDSVWHQTALKDVYATLLKSAIFGYIIVVLSTSIGLNTTGGAKEVGIATTRAVVWTFMMVAFADYLITYLIYGNT